MPRLAAFLIAAVFAVGLGGAQLAQSQTEPPAGQAAPAAKAKKGMTVEEKAKLKEERAATKAAKMKAREEKKAANAAKKAKREECRTQAKQSRLKGKKQHEFVQTCVGA